MGCWRAGAFSRQLVLDVSLVRRDISKLSGCFYSFPRNTMQKMSQASSWEADSSKPATEVTFCFPISRIVSEKEVSVPPPKIAPRFLVSGAASEPAEGGGAGGKRKNLSLSPTPSGSLVWKTRAITITATAWGMRGG